MERGAHPQDSDLMVSTGALRHTRAQDMEPDPLSVLKLRARNRLERSWTESERRAWQAPHPAPLQLWRAGESLPLSALQGRNF